MSGTMPLLCSTGAFSRYPDYTDYRAVLTYGPQLAVDGLELMFYPAWVRQLDEVVATLGQSRLRFPALHVEKSVGTMLGSVQEEEREQGLRMLEANCRLGHALGTELLVLHLWGWPELDDRLEINLSHLAHCLDLAQRYGLELAVETIPARNADPLSNVLRAVEQDRRTKVALDTEFLARYGQVEEALETAWLWQEPIVRHIHIKDFEATLFSRENSRRYLHPGEGEINFAHVFAALKAHNFHGNISLEASAINAEGVVNVEQLQKSLHLLRQLINGQATQ
ncbi:MAG TPA: sugar phosphate isomerase/epimerase family protein [Ktedonobacteraceae bacterium]|nr:sugar phosphate isomerase/epimerase family protein [Ktedonobacteraceae bacterium]